MQMLILYVTHTNIIILIQYTVIHNRAYEVMQIESLGTPTVHDPEA